jgi:hypothetical protein
VSARGVLEEARADCADERGRNWSPDDYLVARKILALERIARALELRAPSGEDRFTFHKDPPYWRRS